MTRKACSKSEGRGSLLLLARKRQHTGLLPLPQLWSPQSLVKIYQDCHQCLHTATAYLQSALTRAPARTLLREVRLRTSLKHLTRTAMAARPAADMRHTNLRMVVLLARTHLLRLWCLLPLAFSTQGALHQPATYTLLPIRVSLFQQHNAKILQVGMTHLSWQRRSP